MDRDKLLSLLERAYEIRTEMEQRTAHLDAIAMQHRSIMQGLTNELVEVQAKITLLRELFPKEEPIPKEEADNETR